jgi:hypothetical protein
MCSEDDGAQCSMELDSVRVNGGAEGLTTTVRLT